MSNKELVEDKFKDLKNNLDTAQLCLNNVYQDLSKLKEYINNYFSDEQQEAHEDCPEKDTTLDEIIKEITDRLDKIYGSKISIVVKEVK